MEELCPGQNLPVQAGNNIMNATVTWEFSEVFINKQNFQLRLNSLSSKLQTM